MKTVGMIETYYCRPSPDKMFNKNAKMRQMQSTQIGLSTNTIHRDGIFY
jgi:hypothetical protein